MTEHLLGEGELLADVYRFVHPYVEAARAKYGPLISMKTSAWLDAPAEMKLAVLLVLAEAYVLADPHQVVRERLRAVADDVHGGDTAYWRDWAASSVPYDELKRRRGA